MSEQQIQIKAEDSVLAGKYSNSMQISHTKDEFVLDFFSLLPPAGQLVSRIVTNPSHFKRIIQAMQENLDNYEKAYGKVSQSVDESHKIGFKTS